jgi:hypothetical protein
VDLRSVKPGLSAAPLFMLHPKTGEMITPLGYGKAGQPWWPVMGGAPEEGEGDDKDGEDDSEEEEEDEDDNSGDDNDEDEQDEDQDDDDDKKGKGKKKGNPQAKIAALTEEKDRHFRKAKKANKLVQTLQSQLDDMKAKYESGNDKGKGKDDKDKPPVDDTKIKAAEAKAQRLAVENAFLRVNEIVWIKPEQALALMQSDDDYDIEFDEDGKVDRKSLRAELKRFAKANPHLIKKAAPKDDEDDADEGTKGQRSTAPQMNGKRKGKGKSEPTRADLAKKFPALNRLAQ